MGQIIVSQTNEHFETFVNDIVRQNIGKRIDFEFAAADSGKIGKIKVIKVDCFHEWAEWENDFYIETYCHHCNKKKDNISFAKPQCYSCYTSQNNFVRL